MFVVNNQSQRVFLHFKCKSENCLYCKESDNVRVLFSVVRLACSVGRRVSWSVSVSHFLSASVCCYPVFSALHLPDVGVGEGFSFLRNMFSLSTRRLSSTHVNPPFRSSDPSTKRCDGCEALQTDIDFFFFLPQHPQFMLSHTWVPPL